jgi:hypothetical protein
MRIVSELRVVSLDRARFQALVDTWEWIGANLASLVDHRTCSARAGAPRLPTLSVCRQSSGPAAQPTCPTARDHRNWGDQACL